MTSIMSSFCNVIAKDDGIYCLVREHWLSILPTMPHGIHQIFQTQKLTHPFQGVCSFGGVIKGFFFTMENVCVHPH